MKKFLFKVFAGLAVLVFIILLLNNLYIRTDYYKNLNELSKFEGISGQLQIANLGNSHSCYSLDWSAVDWNAANLALPTQTFRYDEAVFDNFASQFADNGILLIEVTHRSLYETENFSDRKEVKGRYYRILENKYIPDWDLSDAIRYKYLPIAGEGDALKYILFDSDPNEVSELIQEERLFEDSGKNRAAIFIRQIGEQKLGEEYQALTRIIEKGQKKGLKVVLITSPTLTYFSNEFSDNFYRQFYSDMKQICSKYDNIPYFDYTHDERFNGTIGYFMDADHLNSKGAEYFTNIMLKDMSDRGITPSFTN